MANGIGQDSAGVITAGTLIGDAGSGGADFSAAINVVTDLGPFATTTGFALNNDTPILTVVGRIDGGPFVSLTNTGSIAIDAPIDPTNIVTLVGDGLSQNAAGIITAGTLVGNAGSGGADFGAAVNLVTNLGTFSAATGFTLNDNVTTLTVIGPVNGGTGVMLTNTGSLAIDAALTGTGTVDLIANGIGQDSAGVINAGTLMGNAGTGGADFGAAVNLVTDLGTFSATTGFTLNDNVTTLTVIGPVNGGTGVALTNTGSLAIDAALTGTGTVDLIANGIGQDSVGVITAGTLTGNAGAGAADLDAAVNLVTNLGTFSATTGFTLNNDTPILTVVGPVNGGTGVALTNTGSLAINAALTGTGTVDLIANGIGQDSAGVITAGTLTGDAGAGAADLGAAVNLVTDLGTFSATTGFTLNDNVATLTVIGPVNGGTGVALTNTGSLAINAALTGTGTVGLVANGIGQDSSGVITAGTLTGDAGAGAADLGAAVNLVTDLGTFSATTGFTLNDNVTTLTVIDPVNGGTGVALTNIGSLAINAALTGTGTVDLIANGIGQDSAGVITAGTLTGNAGAGPADLGAAINLVSNLGTFSATTGFHAERQCRPR